MHPPPRPRDLRIDGLADERVTKRRDALVCLDEEARLDRLLDARITGKLGHESRDRSGSPATEATSSARHAAG